MSRESSKTTSKSNGAAHGDGSWKEFDHVEVTPPASAEDSDVAFTVMGFLREADVLAATPSGRPAVDAPLTGRRLGSYEVGERLGDGVNGPLYKAHDVTLRRDVSIEILPAALRANRSAWNHVERDVRSLTGLDHQNIAAVHGVEERDDVQFLVFELVEGPTLAERLVFESALPVEEALDVAHQIARALDAAHARGVVHRDLRPAVIRVSRAGLVKVLDFGLSAVLSSDGIAGRALVPLSHLAPERAHGHAATRGSDIWSFGVILYQLLAGRLPFEPGIPVATDTLTRSLAALPKRVQSELTPLLARALAIDVADRYQAMSEVIADLERATARVEANRARGTAPWVLDRDTTLAVAEDATPAVKPTGAVPSYGSSVAPAELGPKGEEPDFSGADALAEIRTGQRRLRDYRTRALQLTGVEDVVTKKVLADYDSREQELERKAAPLIHTVRHEHDRLRRIAETIRRADEEARLLKAEADLRHAVGEIDEVELASRVRGPEETRARCADRLAALDAADARFRSALEMEPTATLADEVHTRILETTAASSATLVLMDSTAPRTFRLSATSSIGRGEGSDIRLASPRVSQRHAVVHVDAAGVRVQDCSSANGTFVNGERVSERKLEEGDRIRIGELELVFHANTQATVCH